MKKIILTGLVMIALHSLSAQEIIFSTGLSLHSLEKLKGSQPFWHEEIPVQLKETQSFPSYLQFALALRFPLSNSKITLGGNIYSTSTAARSVYEDYSGSFHVDQRLRCAGLGFTFTYAAMTLSKSNINLYTSFGVEASTLKAEAALRVSQSYSNTINTYQAIYTMAEVGVEYQYNLSQKLFFHSSFAFHLNNDAMLINKDDDSEYQYVNWTGGKLLVGIGYRF